MSSYDDETINARNPLARYAHRNRVERSVALAQPLLGTAGGRLLDYGCGSGVFVARMSQLGAECVGYEPHMAERNRGSLPVFSSLADIETRAPYRLITLFETIEHLTDDETGAFFEFARRSLAPGGQILISAPIEIGPALVAKDLNRFWLRGRRSEHGAVEFAKAALLGVAARRAPDVKGSHRGFDFRQSIARLRDAGWKVRVLSYGPLPIPTWYGNSQVYLTAARDR